jgi:hypothetical protein
MDDCEAMIPFVGDAATSRVLVFSHPNHELAVYGLVQRLRPHLIFLTDGGGAQRVEQTEQGLERICLRDRALFLDYSEASFYDALLDGNVSLFHEAACQIREALDRIRPEQVLCDAVEFYNPVHDLSLPIVLAALAGADGTALFEVPLVYQVPGDTERYAVQRMPPSRAAGSVVMQLTEAELNAKLAARDEVYSLLRDQLGPVLALLGDEHFAREEIAAAPRVLPVPDDERVLRFEWRGKLHQQRGVVDRVITYAEHYLPVASSLRAARGGFSA